ncbi:MAG: hypothetical protein ACK4WC_03105 [Rubrimonas sp.]
MAMTGPDGPAHNRAFDLLAGADHDVEGLLAYAYYKRHKRAWLLEFQRARGRDPDPVEVRAFADGACVEDQLARYRQQAQNALVAYAGVYVDQAAPDIAREAVTARIEEAAGRIERQAELLPQVRVALVSTLMSTAILVVLAIGVRLMGIDLIEAVSNLSGTP